VVPGVRCWVLDPARTGYRQGVWEFSWFVILIFLVLWFFLVFVFGVWCSLWVTGRERVDNFLGSDLASVFWLLPCYLAKPWIVLIFL